MKGRLSVLSWGAFCVNSRTSGEEEGRHGLEKGGASKGIQALWTSCLTLCGSMSIYSTSSLYQSDLPLEVYANQVLKISMSFFLLFKRNVSNCSVDKPILREVDFQTIWAETPILIFKQDGATSLFFTLGFRSTMDLNYWTEEVKTSPPKQNKTENSSSERLRFTARCSHTRQASPTQGEL